LRKPFNYITLEGQEQWVEERLPNSEKTFRADFNELLFISIALKLIEILEDFDGNHDRSS
jgi:hypothetical protein